MEECVRIELVNHFVFVRQVLMVIDVNEIVYHGVDVLSISVNMMEHAIRVSINSVVIVIKVRVHNYFCICLGVHVFLFL